MRVVLDTNVVLSALIFRRGHLVWLRELWTRGSVKPLIDKPCAEELLRVLSYPKFRLNLDEIEALLGAYVPYTEAVDTARTSSKRLPRCRDPDDQKFLVLAQAAKAHAIVTGDQAVLALEGKTRFLILKPAELRARLKA